MPIKARVRVNRWAAGKAPIFNAPKRLGDEITPWKYGANLSWHDWVEKYAPKAAEYPHSEHHAQAWEWFEDLSPGIRPPAFIACWPRGHGKSTTAEHASARSGIRGRRKFCLYVSGTQEAADRHVGEIEQVLAECGVGRKLDRYGRSAGWSQSRLIAENGFTVLAFGLDAKTRGVKIENQRPDLIILDDIDEPGDSSDVARKKYETIVQTVLPAGSRDCAIAFIQNKIHAGSVMSQMLSGDLDMLRNRVETPVLVAVDGLDYEEFDGPDGRPRYRITKGTPTWEGKPLSACEQEMNDFGLISFLRECQQEVGAGGLLLPYFEPQKDGAEWHICEPFVVPDHWTKWGSHDYGTSANGAGCSHVAAADEKGDIYVIGEVCGPGQSSSHQAFAFLKLLYRLGLAEPQKKGEVYGPWNVRLQAVTFDHANTFPPADPKQRIGEYPVEVWWSLRIPCIPAIKNRIAGWEMCNNWLSAKKSVEEDDKRFHRPRIRIFRGACPQLVRFLETAMCDPKNPSDLDPGFKFDHPGDSFRYLIMLRSMLAKNPNLINEMKQRFPFKDQRHLPHALQSNTEPEFYE
jgi:hypothetical protein